MQPKTKKHCKIEYKTIVPYTDESLFETIEVNGKQYTITYLPRPCKSVSDLFSVFHNGIKFPTFAKFLKSLS